MNRAWGAILVVAFCGSLGSVSVAAPAEADPVRTAMQRGVSYLLESQNSDGSWGGFRNSTFTSGFANPATYHCWQVGTTALVAQTLMKWGTGHSADHALDRGLHYLVNHSRLVRPAEWDVDNNWGLLYGLNTLALAMQDRRYAGSSKYATLQRAAQDMVYQLQRYQSPRGGWGYYASAQAGWRPDWATSFTTAVGVIALVQAKKAGLEVDEKMFVAAVRAVESSRLPNGAYEYDVRAVPRHLSGESINQVKGSLGRVQICNYALLLAKGRLAEGVLATGMEQFFQHHKFLAVARNKPIPHEAYYGNAAYFYLFGHYYASLALSELPFEERRRWTSRLQEAVLVCQQSDGSMWDFWLASNTKPYGTAFGVLALGNTLAPASPAAE